MSKLEDYIRSITKDLDLPPVVIARIQDEALAHLDDERARCEADGFAESESEDAAIERFGRHDVIAGMIDAAMAERQASYRRSRNIYWALGVGVLILVGVVIGGWFTAFDDAVSGIGDLPFEVFRVVYVGGGILCLSLLAIIAACMFRVKIGYMLIAIPLVASSFYLARQFPVSRELFYIPPGLYEEPGIDWNAARLFFYMRLYVCWVPMIAIAPVTLLLKRNREIVTWLIIAAGIGLLSALLWSLNYGNFYWTAPWLFAFKAPKLLSTGLMAAAFMIQAGALGRAMQARFQKTNSRHAGESPAVEMSKRPGGIG